MKKTSRFLSFLLAASFLFLTACKKEYVTNVTNSVLNPPIANAGQPQNLTANSVTLSGTGTSDNGPITGYLWSLIDGPNLPAILTPSAATTTVTGLTSGSYHFQFAVIDSMGLTGVDTIAVIVSAAPVQTLTIQPTNNPWEWHFWGNNTQNQSGHATQLEAGAWTNGGQDVLVHGAFQLNFSVIPASATILSAKLSLYSTPNPLDGDLVNANSGPNNSMYIRRISTNWTAIGSTWLNQPSTTTADQVAVPATSSPFLDIIDVDVTTLVTAMHNTNNYGFMISLQNETSFNIRQFCSSIHTDATKHPKLVITYQ